MAAAQRRRASAAARRGPKSDCHTAPSSFIRQTTAAVIPVYPDDTNADMFGASLHLWLMSCRASFVSLSLPHKGT